MSHYMWLFTWVLRIKLRFSCVRNGEMRWRAERREMEEEGRGRQKEQNKGERREKKKRRG